MDKSSNSSGWFSVLASGSPGSSESWRRRPWSPGPSTSTTLSAPTVKEDVVIPDDEEDQQLPLLTEVARTDEEYPRQLELLLERSLFDRGPMPPSSSWDCCVREESVSPPRHHVKTESTSHYTGSVGASSNRHPRRAISSAARRWLCHPRPVGPDRREGEGTLPDNSPCVRSSPLVARP